MLTVEVLIGAVILLLIGYVYGLWVARRHVVARLLEEYNRGVDDAAVYLRQF